MYMFQNVLDQKFGVIQRKRLHQIVQPSENGIQTEQFLDTIQTFLVMMLVNLVIMIIILLLLLPVKMILVIVVRMLLRE